MHAMSVSDVSFEPVRFADLPGWHDDTHDRAFQAFQASSRRLLEIASTGTSTLGMPTSKELLAVAQRWVANNGVGTSQDAARQFFEQNFTPLRVVQHQSKGLLTGYYEPKLQASRTKSDAYSVALLRRPQNLVNLVSEADRGQFGDQLTHAFLSSVGMTPCPTRADIEQGALADQDLVFAWLACPVDAFFLHVEGSGVLVFEDGTTQRITYDGKNGHPYTSVGKYLIDQGVFQKGELSFQKLKTWLQADLDRARDVLWQNKSYIFFRPLSDGEPDCALGVMQIPLHPLRSLAVDTTYHEIGTPIFVSAPTLSHVDLKEAGFNKLMIAHDVGSAIRGPERGDIFFGSGSDAGDIAGLTVHPTSFFVLKPRVDRVTS